jgi:outer membrane protein assembly factor BamB
MRVINAIVIALGLAVSVHTQAPVSTDWPQWRGPERNGLSREVGLAREWPATGPPELWTATGLGAGYGTVAVSGGRLFVQSLRGGRSTVHAINATDGTYIWSKNLGPGATNDRGSGPRGTPTVDGDRLYVLTEGFKKSDVSRPATGTRESDYELWWKETRGTERIARFCIVPTVSGRSYGWILNLLVDEKGVWSYSSKELSNVFGGKLEPDCTVSRALPEGRLSWRVSFFYK